MERGSGHVSSGSGQQQERPSLRRSRDAHDARHAAPADLLDAIRCSVIGADAVLSGPFGRRRIVYADYTASGRALGFIEDFIRESVLPYYANTHTRATSTGRHTTFLREEARSLIRDAVGAGPEHAVLFCGSGATAAIDRMLGILELRQPSETAATAIAPDDRPVVFIGPYEHHSNELPWRESSADVVVIQEDRHGHVDVDQLAAGLERHAGRPLKIGSFSAASNVTGILTDTGAIAALLHAHGGLAFFDYAAAAPYVEIAVKETEADAIFLSPHKFPGGPGTPGVLVFRRDLAHNAVPAVAGGGTVRYVSAAGHRYHDDAEAREEAGTPDIVGAIRAGLAFHLKNLVGAAAIHDHERRLVTTALERWSRHPEIELLGDMESERLAIVSFNVGRGERRLHHNFVVALLNDLFGIQARGGLSCAGPYGDRLLRIDADTGGAYQRAIDAGHAGIRPGWVRLNFNYFISDAGLAFMLAAVELIAERGHELLDRYRFDLATGNWTSLDAPQLVRPSLRDLDPCAPRAAVHAAAPVPTMDACLAEAGRILDAAAAAPTVPAALPADVEALRWFALGGG